MQRPLIASSTATTSIHCETTLANESVDLIYLDPPFNSNATYNVLLREHSGEESDGQITAFREVTIDAPANTLH